MPRLENNNLNTMMKDIMMEKQIHSKFKVFVTTPESNGGIPENIHLAMNGFIALNKVAVKSVGVEYVELINKIVISLGYVEDQDSYPVVLQPIHLGQLAIKEGQDLAKELEKALTEAAETQDNSVICHEFYVDKDGNYIALFLRACK